MKNPVSLTDDFFVLKFALLIIFLVLGLAFLINWIDPPPPITKEQFCALIPGAEMCKHESKV